uniref:Uncharacterized protein n=2 Tax=Anguilla anguilla TaxID=7936 RepID=A0A0E9XXZ5_ANGAN
MRLYRAQIKSLLVLQPLSLAV